MSGAELTLDGSRYAKQRALIAARASALLVFEVDHPFMRMFAANLPLLASRYAIRDGCEMMA